MKNIYSSVLSDLLKKSRSAMLPKEDEQPDNMIDMQQDAMMQEKKTPQDALMEEMPDDLKRNMAADNLSGQEEAREGDESNEYNPDDSFQGMDGKEGSETMDVGIPEEVDEIKSDMLNLFGKKPMEPKKTAFAAMTVKMDSGKKPFFKK